MKCDGNRFLFIPVFFLMLLWGVIAPEIGLVTIGYPMAMLATVTLWIAVAPLAATGSKKKSC